jgi:hypothetical protein
MNLRSYAVKSSMGADPCRTHLGGWSVASVLRCAPSESDVILYSLQQALAVAGLLSAGLMTVVLVGEIDISFRQHWPWAQFYSRLRR